MLNIFDHCLGGKKLFLQLHVHSDKSFDSSTKISEYVSYLHNLKFDYDCAVLGITDHNVVPITVERALECSTNRVLVIPGMQWRFKMSLSQRFANRATRREMVTLGDHDGIHSFIEDKTNYSIASNGEILGHPTEDEFLNYVECNPNIAIVVPHPPHFIIDFYGKAKIATLRRKMESRGIEAPFFVETKSGSDLFPRVLTAYENKYCCLGGSDAHQINGTFGIQSMLSVTTTIRAANTFLESWEQIVDNRTLELFKQFVHDFLNSLTRDNSLIRIKKHYGRSALQLAGAVFPWIRRRFENFPRNLFK